MKRTELVIVFLLLVSFPGWTQYSNDWVDPTLDHIKLLVAEDGLYQLSGADIESAGFSLEGIDHRTFRLFHRGTEQAIRVSGQGDGSFLASDLITFFGIRNDGSLDAQLYTDQAYQLNTDYNLFSDTTAYFLTWGSVQGERMTETSFIDPGAVSPVNSAWSKIRLNNTARYAKGRNLSGEAFLSAFDEGEGFSSQRVREGSSLEFNLTGLVNGAGGAELPQLDLTLLGEFDTDHQAEIFAGPEPASMRSLGVVNFSGFEAKLFSSSLQWADIGPAGVLTIRADVQGVGGNLDLMSLPWIEVNYPKTFQAGFNEQEVLLPADPGGESYLEWNDPPADPVLLDISDDDQPVWVDVELNGNLLRSVVPNTISQRRIYLAGSVKSPEIKAVRFRNLDVSSNEYVIITHKVLRDPAGSYSDPVRALAEYRASIAGGSYDTLLINIDEVVDQFGFGEYGPLAIYRFLEYISQQGSPSYLFLIGEAINVQFNYHRNPDGFNYPDLVPTAGYPDSDLQYASGIGSPENLPAFPVGRLTASLPDEVAGYLDKLIEMESFDNSELWAKEILHLSGGITSLEQESFFAYMERFRGYAEDIYLGADVSTIRKNTVENITFINISDEVNNGKSLVTFFGHSNPSITDIEIGKVSDPENGFQNKGKYPLFLVNGCEAGRVFENVRRWPEDWMLTAEKGAIGLIAHSSYAQTYSLRTFSNTFYSNMASEQLLNSGVGDIQLQAIRDYIDLFGTDTYWNIGMMHQMFLLGDPAYRPFRASLPDYSISDDDLEVISFDNSPVLAATDSFAIEFVVSNTGKATGEELNVRLTRLLENGTNLVIDSIFPPVLYQDTLRFIIKNSDIGGAGLNRFIIQLDPEFNEGELNELNNEASIEYSIPLNGTLNVFPPPYSILPSEDLEILVQTTDLTRASASFTIEVDTSYFFNSPFKQSGIISGSSVARWPVTLIEPTGIYDSLVYFWRSRITDPQPGESRDWVQSSFTIMADSPEGWSQGSFFQFLDNGLDGLVPDTVGRFFELEATSIQLEVTNYGGLAGTTNTDVSVRLNGAEYITNSSKQCRLQTTNFIAFDKVTAQPYAALPDPTTKACGREPAVINSYAIQDHESASNSMIDYIDAVGEGDTVVIFTIGSVLYSLWNNTVKTKLGELGVDPTTFDGLTNHDPFIIVGAKGAPPGSAEVYFSDNVPPAEGSVYLNRQVFGRRSKGSMASTRVGPALNWSSFSRSIFSADIADEFTYSIDQISGTGTKQVFTSGILPGTTDLSSIDPLSFPYIELSALIGNESTLEPPDHERWTVIYERPPEGGLFATDFYGTSEYQEGEKAEFGFMFLNLGNKDFPDSLQVQTSIRNALSGNSTDTTFRIKAPVPGDTTEFLVEVNTIGKGGLNDLLIEVNPGIIEEETYTNNRLILNQALKVNLDAVVPVVRVTVDGRIIPDGELVSASPLIRVELRDENKVRILNDTSLMDVMLRRECSGCEFTRLSWSSENTNYEAPDEKQRLVFDHTAIGLEDGIYTLRVESRDVSGNQADDPYEVRFEIVNESSITRFYPYPNPFSDRMQFVFTLTGDELPDDIRVRIMTISGIVVREIDMDELGPIRIGNNASEFRWDGTDEFGQRLANGVYLYQVRVMKDGKELKIRDSAGDSSFRNGIGKIYLAR